MRKSENARVISTGGANEQTEPQTGVQDPGGLNDVLRFDDI